MEDKFYIRSNGEKVKIADMNTEHIINSLSKKYREVFEAKNKSDFFNKTSELTDLKEELYKRFNLFNETLMDDKQEEGKSNG